MPLPRRIHFIRHVPVSNPNKIWYGRDVDYDLYSPAVINHFNHLAQLLPSDPKTARWLASPYPRAFDTALMVWDGIGRAEKPRLELDERFIEQRYGVMEGLTHDAVKNCAGAQAYLQDLWNTPPAGGESMAMLQARVSSGMNALAQDSATDYVIFTHGGVMMAAFAVATGRRMIDTFTDRKAALTPSFSYMSHLIVEQEPEINRWSLGPDVSYHTGLRHS